MRQLMMVACLLGSTMGQYWGHHGGIPDTPEVEAAKAAHFAAHAKANARLGHAGGGAWGGYDRSWEAEPEHHAPVQAHYDEPHHKWTGPVALPPGYDKHGAPLPVHDTPEVAAAKHRFFELYSHGAYAGAYASHGADGWSAPAHESHGWAGQDGVSHGWSTPARQSDWTPTSGPWGY